MKRTPSEALAQLARLFTILHLVSARRAGRPLGRTALANACQCSTKTIDRDLKLLEAAHVPVRYERQERAYTLPDKSAVTSLVTMTPTDALALALMRGLLANPDSPLPFAAEMQTALDKATGLLAPPLQSLMDAAIAGLHEPGGAARDYGQAPVQKLLTAVAKRQTVEMLYASRSSGVTDRRAVDPYRLDRRDGRYLEMQAWCHRRREVRTFALDRVLDLRATGETFTRREWNDSDEGIVGGLRGGPRIAVEVRFDGVVAPFARERKWPFVATFEDAPEGSVVVRGEVQGLDGIVRELLTWRRHAVALGGPELRARMAEEVRAMSALYPDPAPPKK